MDGADTQWPDSGGRGLTLTGGPGPYEEDLVHDELAELFMGPGTQSEPDSSSEVTPLSGSRVGPAPTLPPMGRARIEALLLGHLPVRASLWVRQYASSLAKDEASSVGLVRLTRGGADVERHGTMTDDHFAWWVLRVDEVDQPALMEACGGHGSDKIPAIDRITILTGADDPAVIACYRLLKGLAAELDRRLGDGEGPELAVAIAGCDIERAKFTVRRLREATHRFLGRELVAGPVVSKAGSTNASVIGRWEGTTGVEQLIETIRGGGVAPGSPGDSPSVESQPTSPASTAPEPTSEPAPGPAPISTPSPAPGVPAPPLQATSASSFVEPVGGERSLATGSKPDLATLIEGLSPVDIDCPSAPEISFARDAAGGLHAITRFGREGLDAAMSAGAWAKTHRGLICRIEPKLDMERLEHGCAVHVCGDDARELRQLGDSDVRTHLLRRVPTPGGDVWVCDPLN